MTISVPQGLKCAEDGMVYLYIGVSPISGLLMFRWTAEDGSRQVYEITADEGNKLIDLGWWSPIEPTASADAAEPGAITDEMIEAGSRAVWPTFCSDPWEDATERERNDIDRRTRLTLEAAASARRGGQQP